MAEPAQSGTQRSGTLLPLFLALACVVSGVAVVQVTHGSRAFTAHLNTLRLERDRLEVEWAQLRLEQATLDQHGRVQQLAEKQFDMVEPKDYVIVPEQSSVPTDPAGTPPAVKP